jgi:hypothetical protein
MALQEQMRGTGDPAPPGPPTLLSTPATARGRSIASRVVSTPYASNRGTGGLVLTIGSATVDPASPATSGSNSLWDERNDATFHAMAAGGCRVWRVGDALVPRGPLDAVAGGARAGVSVGPPQPPPAGLVGNHRSR